jgi:serine/threonine protein kinase
MQTVRGVMHLHRRHGLEHRDLKPINLLVTRWRAVSGHPLEIEVKVADFGLVEPIGLVALGGTGTPLFLAPEQFSESTATAVTGAADIWSLGVILLNLFSPFMKLEYQWQGDAGYHKWDADMRAGIAYNTPSTGRHCLVADVPELDSLLKDMLQQEPADRPAIDDVLTRFEAALPAVTLIC